MYGRDYAKVVSYQGRLLTLGGKVVTCLPPCDKCQPFNDVQYNLRAAYSTRSQVWVPRPVFSLASNWDWQNDPLGRDYWQQVLDAWNAAPDAIPFYKIHRNQPLEGYNSICYRWLAPNKLADIWVERAIYATSYDFYWHPYWKTGWGILFRRGVNGSMYDVYGDTFSPYWDWTTQPDGDLVFLPAWTDALEDDGNRPLLVGKPAGDPHVYVIDNDCCVDRQQSPAAMVKIPGVDFGGRLPINRDAICQDCCLCLSPDAQVLLEYYDRTTYHESYDGTYTGVQWVDEQTDPNGPGPFDQVGADQGAEIWREHREWTDGIAYQCQRQGDGTCKQMWTYGTYTMEGNATGASYDQTTQTPGWQDPESGYGYPDVTHQIHVKVTVIGNSYVVDDQGVCQEEVGI